MYLPAHFRSDDPALTAKLVDDAPFATLVSTIEGAPFATHVPLIRGDAPDRLLGHVARANPHAKAFGPGHPVLAIFHGPDAYASPTAYVTTNNVPTWNYAAVHAVGEVHVLGGVEARSVLSKLTQRFEAARPSPWSMESLAPDLVEKLLKAIVAFELKVSRWEVKLKLSQNKSPADVESLIRELERSPDAAAQALAALMRKHR